MSGGDKEKSPWIQPQLGLPFVHCRKVLPIVPHRSLSPGLWPCTRHIHHWTRQRDRSVTKHPISIHHQLVPVQFRPTSKISHALVNYLCDWLMHAFCTHFPHFTKCAANVLTAWNRQYCCKMRAINEKTLITHFQDILLFSQPKVQH